MTRPRAKPASLYSRTHGFGCDCSNWRKPRSRCRRCRSPTTTIWSRHSRRIDPISLSQYPFCHGDRGAVGRSRIPIARRPAPQERHPHHPSSYGSRAPGATASSAGNVEIAVRVCFGARRASFGARFLRYGGTRSGVREVEHQGSRAHMLRHACGYKLANDGHDTRALQAYLGHRNIQNTTRYTALAQDRFKGFWKD